MVKLTYSEDALAYCDAKYSKFIKIFNITADIVNILKEQYLHTNIKLGWK